MRFRFVRKLLLLLSLCCISGFAIADETAPPIPTPLPPDIALIQKHGVLIVAFYNKNVPPFFSHDAQNNWTGIDIDLVQMIANQLGVKVKIITSDTYDGVINLVFTGKADMGIGLLSVTPARELKISFTSPYYSFQRHLLVNRLQAAQYHWNVWQVVSEMEASKKPLKIGALRGGAAFVTVNDFFPNAIPVPYDDLNQAMQDVVAGKIFAVVANSPLQAQDFLKSNPKAVLAAEDVQVNNWVDLLSIAVPWQYYSFRIWLNAYFVYLQSNNLESAIFNKYITAQTVEINNAPAFY